MRIALFTPLAPPPTNLTKQIEALLPFLARGANIDVFVDDGRLPNQATTVQRFEVYGHRAFAGRAAEYDAVVYAIDQQVDPDSYVYDTMQRYPGVLIVHEWALDDTIGQVRWLAECSLGIIVNSDSARRKVRRRHPDCRVAYIPQPFYLPPGFSDGVDMAALRAKWGLEDQFVIGAFEPIDASENLGICLRAFSDLLESRPDAVLLLCGALPPDYDMAGSAQATRLGETVIVTGRMDPTFLVQHMCLVDLALQLQSGSVGRAALTPIRLMGLGVPTIVPDTELMAELPQGACAKVRPDEYEEATLTALLRYLVGHDQVRHQMARNGRLYVEAYHSLERLAEQYLNFVGAVSASLRNPSRTAVAAGSLDLLIQDVAGTLAEWRVTERNDYLLLPISQAIGDLANPFPQDRALADARRGFMPGSKISVIIPAYNAERFLGETIQSVLDQTFQDFEVIVVDDGSTDSTREVVAAFDDQRIRYTYQDNRGPAAARNTGIAAAKGEYIAPLDADDLALPHRFAAQIGILEAHPSLAVVGSGYKWIDEEGCDVPWDNHSWQRWPELNQIRDWLFDCPFVPSATMFRRAAWEDVGGFDEGLIGPEDWHFWMRLVLGGHQMGWHKDVVCLYRHRHDGVSHDAERMTANCAKALRGIMKHPSFPPTLLEAGRQGLAIRYVDGTKRLYTSGLWQQGKEALGEALALDPSLIEGQPSRIEDELLNAALDPLTPEPIPFLEMVFQHLPDGAGPLRARERYMLTRCHVELLARGLRHRDPGGIRRHLRPVLSNLPRWILQRNTWAFIVRAVENRLSAMADRVRGRK
jgi:glycosyltransferase involved in cell wall biosynthesis